MHCYAKKIVIHLCVCVCKRNKKNTSTLFFLTEKKVGQDLQYYSARLVNIVVYNAFFAVHLLWMQIQEKYIDTRADYASGVNCSE